MDVVMLRLITALVVATFAFGSLASPVYAQTGKEPAKTETKQPAAASKKAALDLSTASEEELKTLASRSEPFS
jgi:hypothetical protein